MSTFEKPIEWIKSWDAFAFNSYTALLFNKKKTYHTLFGGISTIFIYSVFAYYWYL